MEINLSIHLKFKNILEIKMAFSVNVTEGAYLYIFFFINVWKHLTLSCTEDTFVTRKLLAIF